MPFILVPVPGLNGKQRTSPGCLLVGGIICFLFLIPVGIAVFAGKPQCGTDSMRVGQECVYRDAETHKIDHTTSYSEEQRDTRLGGLGAIALGSVILFFTVRQFRRHRRRLANATSVVDPHPAPVSDEYSERIATAARSQYPPVPPPPPPPPPPSLHHEA